jgi:hypothetical protein
MRSFRSGYLLATIQMREAFGSLIPIFMKNESNDPGFRIHQRSSEGVMKGIGELSESSRAKIVIIGK